MLVSSYQVTLFDVYKGEHVPEGIPIISVFIIVCEPYATLEEDVIKSTMTRVEEALVAFRKRIYSIILVKGLL